MVFIVEVGQINLAFKAGTETQGGARRIEAGIEDGECRE
jgi:hypothetical protein